MQDELREIGERLARIEAHVEDIRERLRAIEENHITHERWLIGLLFGELLVVLGMVVKLYLG